MTKRRKQPSPLTLTVTELKIIIEHCGNDGHSVLNPTALAGVNRAFVDSVTRTYHSDDTCKGSIHTNKGIVDKMTGIYTLDVLRAAVKITNVDGSAGDHMFERGFAAQAYTASLQAFVNSVTDPV